MKFKKVLIGAASALVLSATVAQAGYERDGWYVGLEGGLVSIPDTEIGVLDAKTDNGMALLDLKDIRALIAEIAQDNALQSQLLAMRSRTPTGESKAKSAIATTT
jgi:hypothetical protein